MQTQFAFLAPLETVKVTQENLKEVAEWCGGHVATAESKHNPGRMDSYVWVPTPKGSTISWAFPGMYVTRRVVITNENELKETWAVFRKEYYDRNYFETPQAAVEATWGKKNPKIAKKDGGQPKTGSTTVVNVFAASGQSPADIAKAISEATKTS